MGLDDFKGSKPSKQDKSPAEKRREHTDLHKIPDIRKDSNSQEEFVERVRQEVIVDYYSDFKLEDGWEYESMAGVTCVCDEKFLVRDHTTCTVCGREYARTGRAVVMTKRGDN